MLQYVIRRLLYSIVVLVVASFLTFVFVAKTGDPLAPLATTPNVSPETVANVREENHLDDSVFVRYWYWVKDATTNQFGTTLLGEKKILPDLWRVMKNTLQLVIVAELLAILVAVGDRRLLGLTAVLGLRLHGHDVQLPGARDATLLAGADAPGGGGLRLRMDGPSNLPDSQPERRRSRNGGLVLDRPGAPPRAAGPRAHDRERRRVLALHARLHARGRELRLRADGPREGPDRAEGHDEARLPQRAHPDRRRSSRSTSARCSAEPSSPRSSSHSTEWACTSSRRSEPNDPYPVMAWLMVTATMVIIFNLIADIAYGYLDPRVRYD